MSHNLDKEKEIDERKKNLPLPVQPPRPSDWQSFDQGPVNVGSGGVEGPISGEDNSALRDPATVGSSARESAEKLEIETEPGSGVGRQGEEHLPGLPKDARTRR